MKAQRIAGEIVRGALVYLLVMSTGPIVSARASEAPSAQTVIFTEACKVTGNGANAHSYAIHEFSKNELASDLGRASALGHIVSATADVPPGFDYRVVSDVYVRDGAVAALCDAPNAAPVDQVLFILPRHYKLDPGDPWVTGAITGASKR
jgi:hypothetical protein